MDVIRKYFRIFGASAVRRALVTGIILIFMGLLESIGMLMVFPFLTAVSSEMGSPANKTIMSILLRIGGDQWSPVVVSGTIALIAVLGAGCYKLFAYKTISRFVSDNRFMVSTALFKAYIHAGIEKSAAKSTSEMMKNVVSEVDVAITSVLKPAVSGLAYAFVVLFIFIFLLFVNIYVAIFGSLIMGMSYLLVFGLVRKTLSRIGQARAEIVSERAKVAANAFNSLRELLVYDQHASVIKRFDAASSGFGLIQGRAEFISESPRILVEAISIGGMLCAVMVLVHTGSTGNGLLAMVGLYAFAAYKVIPALQHAYSDLSKVRYSIAGLRRIVDDIERYQQPNHSSVRLSAVGATPAPYTSIEFVKVGYTLSNDVNPSKEILTEVSFRFHVGEIVAITGPSGAGKSTLADVLIGARPPSTGAILLNGRPIASKSDWDQFRLTIGYVSQQVYLSNTSLLENITFQSERCLVDDAALHEAIRLSALSAYIDALPDGLMTAVADRGEGLSGGQRQRIGLARALYRRPRLLILDEPTSALDDKTELEIVAALREISRDAAVVMIAHRSQAIEAADLVVTISAGRVASIKHKAIA